MAHTRRDGSQLAGVLVVSLTTQLQLLVVDPDTPVAQAAHDWPPAPDMGGPWRPALQAALRLAQAITTGDQVVIGYVKAPGAAAERRTLQALVPTSAGTAVQAHDLDRDAPRTFRLDRITWVGAP